MGVVEKHCEAVGRDPADIRYTVLMPTMVTDDSRAVDEFVANRHLGEGSAAGPKNYVIDRIGEIVDAGASEIMVGGVMTDDLDQYQLIAEEIIPVFG